MTTFEQAKEQNGSVVLGGVEYAITRAAQMDNYGTDGEVRYYAPAIDQAGGKYIVEWETTVEWDASSAILGAEMRGESSDGIAQGYGLPADFVPYGLDDESLACEWDEAADVRRAD